MDDRRFNIPEIYTQRIDAVLSRLGTRLSDSAALATAVRKLSDHYIEHPDAPTPWEKDWAQTAYACYFFPLNYLRVRGVLAEAARVDFFSGLTRYTDFGSGSGAVSLALDDLFPRHFHSGLAIERAAGAVRMHKELQASGPGPTPLTWVQTPPQAARAGGQDHVSLFSFSLTELPHFPAWAKSSAGLVLIEPATHQDGRRLLGWRQDLLNEGWHAWAPCTHQGACPLLACSARDWCHDRIQWQPPAWFSAIEEHLPMRNGSLTCSYVLLRRDPPPPALAGLARLTGDGRREKGASRQMVCRGPKREFLSWQHKHGEPPAWPRGALVRLPASPEEKSNEIRLRPGEGEVVETLPCEPSLTLSE